MGAGHTTIHFFVFAIAVFANIAHANEPGVPCAPGGMTPEIALKEMLGLSSASSNYQAPTKAIAKQQWIAGWKDLYLSSNPLNGPATHLPLSLASEYLDTLQWMKTEIKNTLGKHDPKEAKPLKALLIDLMRLEEETKTTGTLNLVRYLDKTSKFSHLMELDAEGKSFLSPPKFAITNSSNLLKKYPGVIVMPTQHGLTYRDFNDLSPYPIFPLGLTSKTAYADGNFFTSYKFLSHDFDHANIMSWRDKEITSLFDPKNKMSTAERKYALGRIIAKREEFYKSFRSFVDSQTTAESRELAEVIWFGAFHEEILSYSKDTFLDFIKKPLPPSFSDRMEYFDTSVVRQIMKMIRREARNGQLSPALEKVNPQSVKIMIDKLITHFEKWSG